MVTLWHVSCTFYGVQLNRMQYFCSGLVPNVLSFFVPLLNMYRQEIYQTVKEGGSMPPHVVVSCCVSVWVTQKAVVLMR